MENKSKITQYCELLIKWQKHINLIGPKTVDDLYERHIQDSLQIVPHLSDNQKVVDLGSGAGLPGVVVAIQNPCITVTCVDSDQKKIAFLNEVKARIDVPNLEPRCVSWDKLTPEFDAAVSRAAAKLETLLRVMKGCTKPETGVGVFHKGQSWQDEIEAARAKWDFSYTYEPSMTNPEAAVLDITNLKEKA